MLQYYRDWQGTHTPVTTGRALWLPAPFLQTMHYVASRFDIEHAARIEKAKRE